MAYIINKSDGTVLTTVNDATIDTTSCSVSLVGRRSTNYGEAFAENLVHILENFANATAPAAPLAGQFWYDTTNNALKFYNSGVWGTLFTFTGGSPVVSSTQLISTATTGTPPLIVASTTKVTNLNADYVDGYDTSTAATANTIAVRDATADIYARFFQGTATSAKYADVAERFEASEALEPGDVVEIGGSAEIEKSRVLGGSVLGVISTSPALRMNDDAGTDETHPFVAFTGRVPCKVVGTVNKGDRLIASSTPGVACAGTDGFVFGRALEDKTDGSVGMVMIVIGVK